MTEEELTEFLVQSNYIENERTQQAHDDARIAWDYLVQADELTEFTLKETHRFLLRNLAPDWAGKYRKVNVIVGSRLCPETTRRTFRRPSQWEEVPSRMDALLGTKAGGWDEIRSWHIAFEWCHPFRDGNGRTGRIIMNWQRIKQRLPILVIHEGLEQQEYYGWFE